MECAGKYGITLGYSLCHWYYYLCRFGNRIQKKVYKQINKFYIAVMHYGVWLLIFLRKEQMQMKLVLVEKPSVAQSIAKVLGAAKREDGYLEGNMCYLNTRKKYKNKRNPVIIEIFDWK